MAGVNRRMRESSSRKIVAISVLVRRFSRSLLARPRASLASWISSFDVSNSSLADCSSSFMERSSSFEDFISSFAASRS
jgi:hypothetical protein